MKQNTDDTQLAGSALSNNSMHPFSPPLQRPDTSDFPDHMIYRPKEEPVMERNSIRLKLTDSEQHLGSLRSPVTPSRGAQRSGEEEKSTEA